MPDDWEEDYNEALEGMTPEQREKLAKARVNVVPITKGKRKPKPPPPPPPGGWPHWLGRLRRDDRGRVFADLANVMIALRGEEKLVEACAFDEMLQHSIVQKEWPRLPDARAIQPPPHETNDDDIGRLQEWLQRMGLPRVGREIVGQAIEIFAREHRFHPIRVWLEALEWDGVPRLGSWLHICLGTPDDEYHRQVGSMFVIAMVARIFQPGCKADYMIVLEGPQGEEKSKFCRALAGGDAFFSEHLPRIDGDQVRLSMHLRGKWLVEVAELAAMLKSDPEGVKHFVTRQIEKYTPKYGRGEVIEPRQCLFIGTTNEDDYIRDVTGGRRYWPVIVTAVNLDTLAGLRDQLFAEAVHAWREGKHWWPDRETEKTWITPLQDQRQFDDALAERVHEELARTDPETGRPRSAAEIPLAKLGGWVGFDSTRFDMLAQKRVAAILKRAKWTKVHKRDGRKLWRKPEKPVTS